MIDNFKTFSADQLYKNCVFCHSFSEISEIALEYRVNFVENFESTVRNPTSCELEGNEELLDLLKFQEIIFNAYADRLVNCKESDFSTISKQLSEIYNQEEIPLKDKIWISSHSEFKVCYEMTISQIVYACVFEHYPFNGNKVSKEFIKFVEEMYPGRVELMRIFRDKYPDGVKNFEII